jgi:CRP-like cAMP-binding protein
MMDRDRINIVNALKRSDMFLGLEDKYLERIASLPSSREKTLRSGEILFRVGEPADILYVLKEGRVDLVAGVSPEAELGKQKLVVEIVTTGGCLGWSAMVAPHYYFLSAIAGVPSVLIGISGSELMALSDKDDYLGYRVFNGLARIIGSRLRDYEQVLMRGRRWPFLNSNNIST